MVLNGVFESSNVSSWRAIVNDLYIQIFIDKKTRVFTSRTNSERETYELGQKTIDTYFEKSKEKK